MALFSWFWKPKIQKTKTEVVDSNKSTKKNLSSREIELLDSRVFILKEYEHTTKKRKYTSSDNCVIYLKTGFTDIYEIVAAFDLDIKKCVVVIPPPEDIDTKILCPRNIAGVFDPHEKGREVIFPDSISPDTVLFNVKAVDTERNDISTIANTSLFSDVIHSKEDLFKIIFGGEQRHKNKVIEKYLLSLDVIKHDSIFFYLVTRASKEIREKVIDFKEEYFSIKEKCFVSSRVYPSIPDEVHGGSFDWEKAEREAKEGVIIKHFHGNLFYDKLSENNKKLKDLLYMEKARIEFLSLFPGLEEAIDQSGWRSVSHYVLGKESYVPYDRSRYDNYHDYYLRGLKRSYSVWDSFLRDLEKFYIDIIPERLCSTSDKKEKRKVERINQIFKEITSFMLTGEVSNDDDIISFVNLNSSEDIVSQLERNTTFTYVKLPKVDSQNHKLKGMMYKVAIEHFEDCLEKELNSGFIKSVKYSTI